MSDRVSIRASSEDDCSIEVSSERAYSDDSSSDDSWSDDSSTDGISSEHISSDRGKHQDNGLLSSESPKSVAETIIPLFFSEGKSQKSRQFQQNNLSGRLPPQAPPPIDWSSCKNSALPSLMSQLKFTTHYAVCVIDAEIWDNESWTLRQKFLSATFWDHPGKNMLGSLRSKTSGTDRQRRELSNEGTSWSDSMIAEIVSGDEIGVTGMSDEAISKGIALVYTNLLKGWRYMSVFWNCHDFAIRLGHLIILPSLETTIFLRNLIALLRQAYIHEIDWRTAAMNLRLVSGLLWQEFLYSALESGWRIEKVGQKLVTCANWKSDFRR
ncbi:hypothetical protein BO71DRAFT_473667 [Aspergillus ellipticus CBS 707.79]|uniref:PPPDE domain-containing protein n=1 Tax=Aspergillus ellipticus CBS 707.79 TaxID=1448320 RepID=A0A319EVU3_9EURO|nr:hypothetical protein BO71DRAFT_473667 [Aspergillus ellipticus CBS 707.79]